MALVYKWEFGDGEISYDVSPIHVYVYPGRYTVKLTVYDDLDSIENSVVKIYYIYVYRDEPIPRKTNRCFCLGVEDVKQSEE